MAVAFGLALCSFAQPALADAPYTLDQAIARAIATHPDLQVSRDEARKAVLALQDARASSVQLDASVTAAEVRAQQNIAGPGGTQAPSTVPSANGTIDLTVPLFDGWKTPAAISEAHQQVTAADADREEARQQLELTVIQAFWNLRKAELFEANQQTVLDQARRTLDETQAGLAVGRKTPDDVDQARISVLSAQGDELADAGQTQQARSQLAQVLGVRAEGLAISGDPEDQPIDLTALGDVEAALAHRPDAQASRSRMDASQAAFSVAEAARWPQLALTTSYQHGNLATNPVTGVQQVSAFAGTWQAAIGAKYDLFDMGKVNRAVERADLDRQEARANYDKVARQIRADLEQAEAAVRSADQRVKLGKDEVDLARSHLAVTQTRYQQGLALQIEVDDARAKYLSAVNQRVQALIDYEVAVAQLRRAAGLL